MSDIVAVKIAHAEDEETILLAPNIPVTEIAEAVKSLFPTLPGTLKGFRKIEEEGKLGPYIPITLATRTPSLLKDGRYQVQVYPAWRREGIQYEKNELFLDVSETVNLVMMAEDLGKGNSKMTILDTDVVGTMLLRARLSGMPGCKLNYTAQDLETVVYHPCVKVDKYEAGVVKFIPPDGQTELARYRVTKHVKLPFRVLPVIRQLDENRLEIKVNIKAAFSKDVTASDVTLKIPLPRSTVSYTSKVSKGTVVHYSELECLMWKIPKFAGETDNNISAELKLLSGQVESDTNVSTTIPPLMLEFNLVGYVASGLRVRYLEIYESGEYEKDTWIRYMTSAGSYQIKVSAPNVNAIFYTNPQ